jgi:hypothetical protein
MQTTQKEHIHLTEQEENDEEKKKKKRQLVLSI